MNCLIIAIGNELLNGEIRETNSQFLINEFSSYSFGIDKILIITDDEKSIISEIEKGVKEFSFIIIMGGLGPTEDDITRDAVAKALKRPLLLNVEELGILEQKFKNFGRKMAINNNKQTFFPKNAHILANPIGTASGFYLKEKSCTLFVAPGVPSEMKLMFDQEIIPLLEKWGIKKKKVEKLIVKTIGKGESSLDLIVKEQIAPNHNIRWEIIARNDGVFLKFYLKSGGLQERYNWKKRLVVDLEECVGPYIYGYDNQRLEDLVSKYLLENNLTMGCVESCTGGYISKYLTDSSGSSKYFVGSLITYSNDLKNRLANVDLGILEKYGAVSEKTAAAMAIGGKKVLQCHICLSITGIAGPTGGVEGKPVGTVWFGIVDHNGNVNCEMMVFPGGRNDVRERALFYGLNLVRKVFE